MGNLMLKDVSFDFCSRHVVIHDFRFNVMGYLGRQYPMAIEGAGPM